MTNYAVGHLAEKYAAEYLKNNGFEVLELNWRTKYCEIDIIAKKSKTIYFIEVKYRRSGSQGFGIDYITTKKLRQMSFAAELWASNHKWSGEYALSALELSGDDFLVTNFIENL